MENVLTAPRAQSETTDTTAPEVSDLTTAPAVVAGIIAHVRHILAQNDPRVLRDEMEEYAHRHERDTGRQAAGKYLAAQIALDLMGDAPKPAPLHPLLAAVRVSAITDVDTDAGFGMRDWTLDEDDACDFLEALSDRMATEPGGFAEWTPCNPRISTGQPVPHKHSVRCFLTDREFTVEGDEVSCIRFDTSEGELASSIHPALAALGPSYVVVAGIHAAFSQLADRGIVDSKPDDVNAALGLLSLVAGL